MAYLMTQIFFCLLAAFLLGLLTGWFFGRLGRKSEPQTLRNNTPRQAIPTPARHSVNTTDTPSTAFTTSKTPPPPPPIAKSHDGKTATEKLAAVPPSTKSIKKAETKEASSEKPKEAPKTTSKATEAKTSTKEATPKTTQTKASTKPAKITKNFDFSSLSALKGKGYEIETLEGVGPKTGKALREIGLKTIADFLEAGHKPEQRAEIATKIAVRPKMVDSWAGMSDLLRIKGVDHQTAELMHKSGVLTVTHLAAKKAPEFVREMEEINTAGKRSIAPEVPGQNDVNSWIDAASKLDAIVKV